MEKITGKSVPIAMNAMILQPITTKAVADPHVKIADTSPLLNMNLVIITGPTQKTTGAIAHVVNRK